MNRVQERLEKKGSLTQLSASEYAPSLYKNDDETPSRIPYVISRSHSRHLDSPRRRSSMGKLSPDDMQVDLYRQNMASRVGLFTTVKNAARTFSKSIGKEDRALPSSSQRTQSEGMAPSNTAKIEAKEGPSPRSLKRTIMKLQQETDVLAAEKSLLESRKKNEERSARNHDERLRIENEKLREQLEMVQSRLVIERPSSRAKSGENMSDRGSSAGQQHHEGRNEGKVRDAIDNNAMKASELSVESYVEAAFPSKPASFSPRRGGYQTPSQGHSGGKASAQSPVETASVVAGSPSEVVTTGVSYESPSREKANDLEVIPMHFRQRKGATGGYGSKQGEFGWQEGDILHPSPVRPAPTAGPSYSRSPVANSPHGSPARKPLQMSDHSPADRLVNETGMLLRRLDKAVRERNELQDKNNDLEMELKLLRQKLEGSGETTMTLRGDMRLFKTQLEDSRDENERLKERLQSEISQKDEAIARISELEQVAPSTKLLLQRAENEKMTLEMRLASEVQKVKRLEDSIDLEKAKVQMKIDELALEAEGDTWEIKRYESALREREITIAGLRTENERLKAGLLPGPEGSFQLKADDWMKICSEKNELVNEKERLSNLLMESEKAWQRFDADQESLRHFIRDTEDQLTHVKRERDQLAATISEVKLDNEKLKKDLRDSREEVSQMVSRFAKERAEWDDKMHESEIKAGDLKDQVREAQRRHEDAQSSIKYGEQVQLTLKEKIVELEQKCVENSTDPVWEQLRRTEDELSETRAELVDSKTARESLCEVVDVATVKVTTLSEQIDSLNATIENLQDSLAEETAKREGIATELEFEKKTNANLNTEFDELFSQIKDLESRLSVETERKEKAERDWDTDRKEHERRVEALERDHEIITKNLEKELSAVRTTLQAAEKKFAEGELENSRQVSDLMGRLREKDKTIADLEEHERTDQERFEEDIAVMERQVLSGVVDDILESIFIGEISTMAPEKPSGSVTRQNVVHALKVGQKAWAQALEKKKKDLKDSERVRERLSNLLQSLEGQVSECADAIDMSFISDTRSVTSFRTSQSPVLKAKTDQ